MKELISIVSDKELLEAGSGLVKVVGVTSILGIMPLNPSEIFVYYGLYILARSYLK